MKNELLTDFDPEFSLERLRQIINVPAYPLLIAPTITYERFTRRLFISDATYSIPPELVVSESRLLETLFYFSNKKVPTDVLANTALRTTDSKRSIYVCNLVKSTRKHFGANGKRLLMGFRKEGYTWIEPNIDKTIVAHYFKRSEYAPRIWYDYFIRGLRISEKPLYLSTGLSFLLELFICNPEFGFSRSDIARMYFKTNQNIDEPELEAVSALFFRLRKIIIDIGLNPAEVFRNEKIDGIKRIFWRMTERQSRIVFPVNQKD